MDEEYVVLDEISQEVLDANRRIEKFALTFGTIIGSVIGLFVASIVVSQSVDEDYADVFEVVEVENV